MSQQLSFIVDIKPIPTTLDQADAIKLTDETDDIELYSWQPEFDHYIATTAYQLITQSVFDSTDFMYLKFAHDNPTSPNDIALPRDWSCRVKAIEEVARIAFNMHITPLAYKRECDFNKPFVDIAAAHAYLAHHHAHLHPLAYVQTVEIPHTACV